MLFSRQDVHHQDQSIDNLKKRYSFTFIRHKPVQPLENLETPNGSILFSQGRKASLMSSAYRKISTDKQHCDSLNIKLCILLFQHFGNIYRSTSPDFRQTSLPSHNQFSTHIPCVTLSCVSPQCRIHLQRAHRSTVLQ